MGFTTPCFIRKNTERLRESLKRLGIRPLLSNERLNAIGDNIKVYHVRDDTDNNQMFINGKGDWGICRDNTEYGGLSGIDFYGMPNDLNVDNYHKATVEELIEHFKGKEESCQDL